MTDTQTTVPPPTDRLGVTILDEGYATAFSIADREDRIFLCRIDAATADMPEHCQVTITETFRTDLFDVGERIYIKPDQLEVITPRRASA